MIDIESITNKIINADCMDILKELPDKCIDLIVTSPPYDNLRTYNNTLEWSFNIFQNIAKELARILKNGGVIVWIVADATINGSETGTSFKQALYFKEIGLNIHDTMIWESNKPPLTHNRYEQCFEYMFIFSKGKPKTFNPIKEKCKNFGKIHFGTFRHDKNNLTRAHSISGLKDEKIKNNIWFFNTGASFVYDKNHSATFPEQLVYDHIISWSNKNDVVLDPFVGSGTTCKVAYDLKRKYIGIEKVEEYYKIACERLENAQAQMKLF